MTRSARPLLFVAVLVLVTAVALAVTRMADGDGSEVVASGDREQPAELPDGAPDPPSDAETPGGEAEAGAPDGEADEAGATDAPSGEAAPADREAGATDASRTLDGADQPVGPDDVEGAEIDPDRTDADPSGPLPDTGPAGAWTAVGVAAVAAAAGGSRPRRGR